MKAHIPDRSRSRSSRPPCDRKFPVSSAYRKAPGQCPRRARGSLSLYCPENATIRARKGSDPTPYSAGPRSSFAQRSGSSPVKVGARSEEHTSELQSLMRISYAVLCLKKKKHKKIQL